MVKTRIVELLVVDARCVLWPDTGDDGRLLLLAVEAARVGADCSVTRRGVVREVAADEPLERVVLLAGLLVLVEAARVVDCVPLGLVGVCTGALAPLKPPTVLPCFDVAVDAWLIVLAGLADDIAGVDEPS